MPHFAATGSDGLFVYEGEPLLEQPWGMATPPLGGTTCEKEIAVGLPRQMRTFTIYLPLYASLKSLAVGLDTEATIAARPATTITTCTKTYTLYDAHSIHIEVLYDRLFDGVRLSVSKPFLGLRSLSISGIGSYSIRIFDLGLRPGLPQSSSCLRVFVRDQHPHPRRRRQPPDRLQRRLRHQRRLFRLLSPEGGRLMRGFAISHVM